MAATELTKADFQSDQETRWCPGCGDYAVLAAVQGFFPELGHPARARRVRVRHRLRRALRVLHGHVRDARHPRPRAGAGDRPGGGARGPLDLGRDRRRRRAVDRRQPPDPRAAPQRAGEDPALQQPDLRAHQGAGVADVRARQGDEVDAVRVDRRAVQPGVAGARRRGDVRGAHDRHRQAPPADGAARGRRARGRGAGRDLPELPGVQRRRVRRAARQEAGRGQPDPARARRADPLRRRGRERRRARRRTASCGSPRSPTWARTRWSSTTRTATTRRWPSRSRGCRRSPDGPTPIGIFRDVVAPGLRPGADARAGAWPGRVRTTRRWTRCCTPGTRGRSPSARAARSGLDVPAGRAARRAVAEMDFALAPPVKAALHAAIDRDDLGLHRRRSDGLLSAFAGFTARRLGWSVDPDARHARHRRDGRRRGAAARS